MGNTIDSIVPEIVFLVGLCVGSFLNVVIYRLPEELSVVKPGSHCPECGHSLAVRDLIPVLSYLVSRGRCRYCGGAISIRYPIIELSTAAIFLFNYEVWGAGTEFITGTIFVVLVMTMAFIDGRHFIIPDVLSLGGLAAGIVISFLPGGISPQGSLFGAFVGGAFLLAVALVGEWALKKEAMGMGDVKMIAMIGSFTGWQGVVVAIFLGSLVGTLVFGPLNIRKRRLIPFGVFLALGGSMAVYLRDPLVALYVSTFWR